MTSAQPKPSEQAAPIQNLLLGAMDNTPCQAAANTLRELVGQLLDTIDALPVEQAATKMAQTPGSHLVLLYTSPEDALAQAMEKDTEPSVALAAWQEAAETLLSVYRRNRHNITLVDARVAAENPDKLGEQLSRRIGVSLNTAQPQGDSNQPDILYQVLASYAIRQSASASQLAGELEASSLPLRNPENALAAADNAYQAIAGHQQGGSEITELKEENELLLHQLHQVQEELESYFLEGRELKAQLSDLEGQLSKLKEEVEKYKNVRHKLVTEIQNMKHSKSWKLTAPLRVVMRPLKGKRKA